MQAILNDKPATMAFAACEEHAGKGLRFLLKHYRTVKVREVNK